MIKAVGKRIVVKEISQEKDEKKLIITVNERKPFQAIIIAAGTEVDPKVELNDIVIIPSQTGTPVEIDGEKYLAIYEDQILAVIGK